MVVGVEAGDKGVQVVTVLGAVKSLEHLGSQGSSSMSKYPAMPGWIVERRCRSPDGAAV